MAAVTNALGQRVQLGASDLRKMQSVAAQRGSFARMGETRARRGFFTKLMTRARGAVSRLTGRGSSY